MVSRDAESSGILWSVISVAAALAAALVLGVIVANLVGEAAAGLIVGGVAFVVLGYVLSYYVLTPGRGKRDGAHVAAAAHAPAAAAPHAPATPAPAARAHAAPLPEVDTPPPGTGISERVREAARAAGEAARAAAGDAGPPAEPAGRPLAFSAPLDGEPDNLMRIRGVGPRFSELLNAEGIYRFSQIAAWGPAEIDWIEAKVEGFSGRVLRDDWIGQSKILAAGGETEHSQRVDRGEST